MESAKYTEPALGKVYDMFNCRNARWKGFKGDHKYEIIQLFLWGKTFFHPHTVIGVFLVRVCVCVCSHPTPFMGIVLAMKSLSCRMFIQSIIW